MNVEVSDIQAVTSSETTLLSSQQPSSVNAMVMLENIGSSSLTYRFDQYNGTAWVPLGISGTPFNNILAVNGLGIYAIAVVVNGSYPQWRVNGSGWTGSGPGGTSTLKFTIVSQLNRASGGSVVVIPSS